MHANRNQQMTTKSWTAGLILGALALAGLGTVGCDDLNGISAEKIAATSRLIPCCPSSERFKENIAPLTDALYTIEHLQGVSFDYKPEYGGRHAVGFLAEDVAQVLPEVVDRDETGQPSRVEYAAIVPVTVEAIKQLRAENAALQARLAKLEAAQSAGSKD